MMTHVSQQRLSQAMNDMAFVTHVFVEVSDRTRGFLSFIGCPLERYH